MSSLMEAVRGSFESGDAIRGDSVFRAQRVNLLTLGPKACRALVAGSRGEHYVVIVDLEDASLGELGVFCDCARFTDGFLCKHTYAVLKAIDELGALPEVPADCFIYECDPEDVETGDTKADWRAAALVRQPRQAADWRSTLKSVLSGHRSTNHRKMITQTQVLANENWFLLDLSEFAGNQRFRIHAVHCKMKANGQWGQPTHVSDFDRKTIVDWNLPDRRAIALLYKEQSYQGYASVLRLNPELLRESLRALVDTQRFAWTPTLRDRESYQRIAWDGDNVWELAVQVEEKSKTELSAVPILRRAIAAESDGSLSHLETRSIAEVVGVCDSGAILFQDRIGMTMPASTTMLRAWQRMEQIDFPRSQLGDFMKELAPVMALDRIELPLDLQPSCVQVEPSAQLHLKLDSESPRSQSFLVEIYFKYADQLIRSDAEQLTLWADSRGEVIPRDRTREAELLTSLRPFPFQMRNNYYTEETLAIHRKWLPELVRELSSKGWEVVAEGRLQRSSGNFSVSIESGEDWFDVEAKIDFDGASLPMPELLEALRTGRKTVLLDDGTQGVLPEEWLRRLDSISSLGSVEENRFRFRPTQALMLDVWLEDLDTKADRSFTTWCNKLARFSGVKPSKEPRGFQGELREYQREGLGWFKFLNDFGFGGCLADDMGLGKTIQVLALLEKRRLRKLPNGQGRKPSLAIVPKSLVYNWCAEAERFAPKLKVLDYTGLQRRDLQSQFNESDLIVTTYATMRNDIDMLKETEFDYVILDEAQAIKNPTAQASKAVRLLNSDHRLAMTGTPIENHLGDLWSILNFLNPGMLGNLSPAQFSRDDPEAEQRLKSLSNALRPFILRRTKEQVLSELPEKTEHTLYCELTGKQKKQYDELRKYYQANLQQKVSQVGLNRAKIHVLEALLRLRQVACDARLVDQSQKTVGAKIELLMDHLADVMEDKRKTLVFSQFTSLLSLLREALEKRGWNYEYLDGKTTQRGARVERFQNDDDCRLFLISLKAGGHGLNLTAADYVFILDPWWNPAVEAQAIDRAHRMGQTKPVVAYRMIARNTVEEKIARLQQSKRKLADAVITADASMLQSLTLDDLQMLLE